jgi:hypothetical protein
MVLTSTLAITFWEYRQMSAEKLAGRQAVE